MVRPSGRVNENRGTMMRAALAGAILLAFALAASAEAAEPELFLLSLDRRDGVSATLMVELASTPGTRAKGLMDRDDLPPDRGMLFDYGAPVMARMWMRRTRIPLDMLFVDAEGTIRAVHAMARPFDETVIASPSPVRWVLEVAGGRAAALGLSPGDRMRPPGVGANP
jgi:uncharacterized membrane protein (UPF0127 family)